MLELRLAWRNIWRHARRTWLTIAAMVFCNVLLIFLISMQYGMYQLMIDNTLRVFTGHLQIQAAGYNDEPAIRDSISTIDSITSQVRNTFPNTQIHVAARGMGFALASSEQRSYGIQVVGVEPNFEAGVSSLPGLITEGRYLSEHDTQSIVIGSVLARNLRITLGQELTIIGSGSDGSFAADVLTIVGIFKSGIPDVDRSMAQIPLKRFQETFSMRGGGHSIVIKVNDFDSIESIKTSVHHVIKPEVSQENDIVVLDWIELQPGLKQAIQSDMASSWFMYGVLIILVAFSVMNTQLMSVLERTKEFGIIMALGLRSRRLIRLVLLETSLMAGVGFLLGIAVGGIITYVIGQVGFTYPGMEEMSAKFNLPSRMYPTVSFFSAIIGPSIIFISSILAACYPAIRLYFLRPITAMRAA
ncbi:MAG: ABC transporter permease [Cellvibrionaceae bacterium]